MEPRVERFHGVCLITHDVQKLSGFYRELLGAEARGDAQFVELVTGGAGLTIFRAEDMQRMAAGSAAVGPGGVVLEFQVADVDLACERLRALAAPIVKPPTTQPWGLRSVWFRDPDGNLVNFFAPVAQAAGAGAVVREYFQRVLNEQDLAACDALLAADYVDHDAPPDTPPGPGSIKAYLAQVFEKTPDLRVTIIELIEDSNRVAARLEWHATRRDSDAPYHQKGMILLRLNEQGQLAERWSLYAGEA